MRSLAWSLLSVTLLGAVARAEPVLPKLIGRLAPGSQLIGCDRAAERVEITADAHLDPTCTYTGGIDVRASAVVVDCRGATIEGADLDGRAVTVRADATVALRNVTVRNCIVRGFQNGIRITRQGFKELEAGHEYDVVFSRIVVENTRVLDTRASGVFVDGYVTGVTLRNVEVAGAGSVGVYLEAGSRDNVITRSYIHDNGYGDVTPEGIPIVIGDVTFRYHSTGREGIAVDGSRNNRIYRNRIAGNSAGGIFLYKNCGEEFTSRPQAWWPRRYGSDDNVISRNEISDGPNGIWIGSRMAENQFFMDCSDPAYVSQGLTRIHEDFARHTRVQRNVLTGFTYAIRVEDDDSRIERNRIVASEPSAQALVLGTLYRTTVLGRPVTGTIVRSNRAEIPGNATPFGWSHQHTATVFAGNLANGAPASLLPVTPPPIDPFLFAKDVFVEP